MVPPRGPPSARLLLLGEAPGEAEDREGAPFVGPSGALLERILASVGLGWDDAYVTNLVKRRPPQNRDPTPEEVAFFAPWAFEEVRLVQPDVVVGVGRHAAHALLCAPGAPGEGSGAGTRKQPPPLGQLRGRWHRPELGGEPRWATAVYHPAYLLRNPQREPESPKAKMWDDIRMIRAKLDELESARTGGGGGRREGPAWRGPRMERERERKKKSFACRNGGMLPSLGAAPQFRAPRR